MGHTETTMTTERQDHTTTQMLLIIDCTVLHPIMMIITTWVKIVMNIIQGGIGVIGVVIDDDDGTKRNATRGEDRTVMKRA